MASPSSNNASTEPPFRKRTNTTTSITQTVAQAAEELLHQDPPLSFWAGAGTSASQAPSLLDIRRRDFGADGWQPYQGNGSRAPRRSSLHSNKESRQSRQSGPTYEPMPDNRLEAFPSLAEEDAIGQPLSRLEDGVEQKEHGQQKWAQQQQRGSSLERDVKLVHRDRRAFSSGWIPPPEPLPWTTSTIIGAKAFFRWATKPAGFFITVYALNVVAWGGMLFLLLCNASPAMCWAPVYTPAADLRRTPVDALKFVSTQPRMFDCNDINSPRRIWLEIDSQILNALFCVTGFGLVPWRFRDLFYLLRFRFTKQSQHGLERKLYGLRVLAGIHRTWFRLPGSATLDELSALEYERSLNLTRQGPLSGSSVEDSVKITQVENETQSSDVRIPLPLSKKPSDPLTDIRAPATSVWKMDFFIWCNVWNTLFQIVLCVFMWHLDRYDRPSWATGLFIALACIIAGAGGIVSFVEGKRVKRVEGAQENLPPAPQEIPGMKRSRLDAEITPPA